MTRQYPVQPARWNVSTRSVRLAGGFVQVAFMDLCGDGLAGIDLLEKRANIQSNQIGVWGLSQGGWLGPLAASRLKQVSFVIAVSGRGVTPGEQMIFQYGRQLQANGLTGAQVEGSQRPSQADLEFPRYGGRVPGRQSRARFRPIQAVVRVSRGAGRWTVCLAGFQDTSVSATTLAAVVQSRDELRSQACIAKAHGPGFKYKPVMSRTFSTKKGSVDNLNVSLPCGCKPKACQIRTTALWLSPTCRAKERVLQ